MKMRLFWSLCSITILLFPVITFATPADEEKKVFSELLALIPKNHIVSIDELYNKWKEVQAKKSSAVILDIRTADEFDSGHLLGANNIDSGHPYLVPAIWPDPNTEIWVLCRTQNRSTYFSSFLYRYGYKNVYLVNGGIVGWAEKGYPLFSYHLGEIKVVKYAKELKEEYKIRQR
jgi:rhodanese-related sulfurtransferase